jgi:UDP-glucose 4-epimerase
MIKTFSKVIGKEVPYVIKPRRPGDIATCYADPSLAKEELTWSAERDLEVMCEDSWRWQKNNPGGYGR